MLASSAGDGLTATLSDGTPAQPQRAMTREEVVTQGPRVVTANIEQVLELSLLRCGRTWLCLFILLICGMFCILIWSQTVYERHKADKCDQPLALMLRLLYIIIPIHAFKRELTQLVLCYDMARDGPLEPCRVKVFKALLMLVTFLWPAVAEFMVLNTGTCSEALVAAVQAIVAYYAAVVLVVVVLPACYVACMLWLVRRGLVRLPRSENASPEGFVERLPKVQFSAEVFDDSGSSGTFPMQCSVCLDDFDASKPISSTLCQPHPHAFHTECLEGWLGCSRTCPLCRTDLVEAFDSAPARLEEGAVSASA
mmetsp:Transcript_115209/g.366178  ORF Transcript_115209/g.366178 Transcript_115209/m.366178 type:complete len:310 (+) Transcript_115209:82-1011(+)